MQMGSGSYVLNGKETKEKTGESERVREGNMDEKLSLSYGDEFNFILISSIQYCVRQLLDPLFIVGRSSFNATAEIKWLISHLECKLSTAMCPLHALLYRSL